jgi:hypothetical protein
MSMNQKSECYGVTAARKVCAANAALWDTAEVQENMRLAPAAVARLEAIEAQQVAEREKVRVPVREQENSK